jgi:hypothetical protein
MIIMILWRPSPQILKEHKTIPKDKGQKGITETVTKSSTKHPLLLLDGARQFNAADNPTIAPTIGSTARTRFIPSHLFREAKLCFSNTNISVFLTSLEIFSLCIKSLFVGNMNTPVQIKTESVNRPAALYIFQLVPPLLESLSWL